MHDHQEGCLFILTCSAVHCHKGGDLVTGNMVPYIEDTSREATS